MTSYQVVERHHIHIEPSRGWVSLQPRGENVEAYLGDHAGMNDLRQVSGRNRNTFEKRARDDTLYVLLHRVWVVTRREGQTGMSNVRRHLR